MSDRPAVNIDVADPPEGVRIELGVTAGQLKVSVTELAEASGISRTSIFSIISDNRWPVRADRDRIKAAIEELMRQRGATEDQVAVLWHAHVAAKGPRRDHFDDDRYGRALGTPRRSRPMTGSAAERPHPDITNTKDTDVLLPKQTLSPAARKAFTLFANPFDGEVVSDEQMFTNGEVAYIREALHQCAVGGRFVALVGESGAGKTTIQGDLEARIERDHKSVLMIKPSVLGMEDNDTRGKTLKATDILAAIIAALDPLATMPQTLEARSKRVAKLLAASIEGGWQHLLVIEEAHCLPEATLKHLKRLHELRLGRKPMLGILLLAQPELALKLDPRRANLREVTQRCEVVHLLPLDGDLKPYLEHRAKAAGRALGDFIDDAGVEEIRARLTVKRPAVNGKPSATSLLYPLAVNNLMTAALNVAADLGAPVVGRDVVRAV